MDKIKYKYERAKKYIDSLSELEQIGLLASQINNVKKYYKAREKSLDTTYNGGELIPRTGVRGGRNTSASAKLQQNTDMLIQTKDDFELYYSIINKKW